jgi:hypothetical protein
MSFLRHVPCQVSLDDRRPVTMALFLCNRQAFAPALSANPIAWKVLLNQ